MKRSRRCERFRMNDSMGGIEMSARSQYECRHFGYTGRGGGHSCRASDIEAPPRSDRSSWCLANGWRGSWRTSPDADAQRFIAARSRSVAWRLAPAQGARNTHLHPLEGRGRPIRNDLIGHRRRMPLQLGGARKLSDLSARLRLDGVVPLTMERIGGEAEAFHDFIRNDDALRVAALVQAGLHRKASSGPR